MVIDLFRHEDIDGFLALAGAEGWICDRWEFDFLFRAFPRGCLTAREGGETAGYITSIKYGSSGWIGNLIVRAELRGKGVGTALMQEALAVLADAGAETVWLTASPSGKPIYEALGFAAVDIINRWVGEGVGGNAAPRETLSRAEILAIDRAGWGDQRETIIDAVIGRGRVLAGSGAFLVSQPCGDGIQIGPWGGGGRDALLLLEDALAETGAGAKVFLDAPARNAGEAALLPGMGFSVRGRNLLMCRGEVPAYEPERVFALASMGSMG